MSYLLALDQGTSSSRSIIFTREGTLVATAQQELQQIYPQPSWVEHNPMEIWHSQLRTAHQAIKKAGISAKQIAAIGITNQRETTVLWDKNTGEPIYNAIVWQDRRTESLCSRLQSEGLENLVTNKTGLRIDPYFSATKINWLLSNVPHANTLAQQGRLAFGTIDSWLIWQLTKGGSHISDVTNASRTMLFNVHSNQWDQALLDIFNIPVSIMPQVQPSASKFGNTHASIFGQSIPISGVAGDQQSALFGQACFQPGMAKNTYGTGCFMLMNTGSTFEQSRHGLITTSAAQTNTSPVFAIEGSVFVAGAVVQWLRDGLKAIEQSNEIESLARSVPDSDGVVFVPAFTGLGAPWWQPNARGTITGITRGTTVAHIARAALESIAFQSASVLQAMSLDAVAANALPLSELRVDGGAAVNNFLMQFQADLLGIPVIRPSNIETTALGAAWLAGLGAGIYSNAQELAALWQQDRVFMPSITRDHANYLMRNWQQAIKQTCTI